MKKHLLLAALAVAPALGLQASTTWTLQGKEYQVDTVVHTTVGPGSTHTSLILSGSSNLRINYTTIDLSNPNVELRTAQASSKLTGGAKVSTMAANLKSSNLQVVSGVNADFFGNQQPIGLTMINGEYWKTSNEWAAWVQMADRTQFAGMIKFSGLATAPDGSTHSVTHINTGRGENNLIIYNPRYGSNTGTNQYGYEVSATPIDGATVAAGKTARLKVTCAPASAGSMAIPSNGYVVSGHGTAAAWVKNLKEGDEITVTTALTCDGKQYDAVQAAGGLPMILSGGEVLNTQGALDHLTSLHPRTAIGYDDSRTKAVILVVDGRWAGMSAGVTSRALADIMKAVGCTEALNFDGGGSSTHWTVNSGVNNHPSDGTERYVANGVFVVSPTPTDNEVAAIEFVDWAISLPRYGRYTPVINTYNKYGVWLGTTTDVTLSCDRELGETTGNTLLASGSGCHALTATYNGCTAKLAVTIGEGEPTFRLDKVLVDGIYDYTVECQALVLGKPMSLDNAAGYWSSDDPTIATIDSKGTIHGVANGTTTIRGSFGAIDRTMQVVVEIPTGHFMSLDDMKSTDGWNIKGTGTTLNSVTPDEVNGGFTIDYTATSGRAYTILLEKPFTTWGRPDALMFDFDPGTVGVKNVKITHSSNGERATTSTVDLSAIKEPQAVEIKWADLFDTSLGEAFPLDISKLLIGLNSSKEPNVIKLGKLRSVYSAIEEDPNSVELTPGIADPDAPVEYYNLQGIRVTNPGTGIYLRRQGPTVTKVLIR